MWYIRPPCRTPCISRWQGLKRKAKIKAVLTQNIDGLHQAAGSKNVFELHGSVLRNYCTRCGKFYDLDYVLGAKGVPTCECRGVIKPDVVFVRGAA
ncbi:MAG: hypothetical protein L6V85_01290 [Clostridiales bacterium]|nr:MAG: hypothetical protein L6V85_01290 [Clostridiales bacterium]